MHVYMYIIHIDRCAYVCVCVAMCLYIYQRHRARQIPVTLICKGLFKGLFDEVKFKGLF